MVDNFNDSIKRLDYAKGGLTHNPNQMGLDVKFGSYSWARTSVFVKMREGQKMGKGGDLGARKKSRTVRVEQSIGGGG